MSKPPAFLIDVEARLDAIARAALRAEAEAAGGEIGELVATLEADFEAWTATCRAALAETRRALSPGAGGADAGGLAREALPEALAPLRALLVRSTPTFEAPQRSVEDDDFVDFSNFGLEDTAAASRTAPAPPVDVRALPTFTAEAREHLDQADLQLVKLESTPDDPEALNALFRCMHTLKGSSAIVGLTPVKELAHEAEQVLDGARSKSIRVEGAVSDVLFGTLDELRRVVEEAGTEASSGRPLSVTPRADVMAALKSIAPGAVSMPPMAALSIVPASLPPSSRAPERSVAPRGEGRSARNDVVRVDASRLDRFVDALGELVIAESMVAHSPDLRASPVYAKLARPLGQLDKLARELQEMATSLRMVPVRDTFQRMHRTVRDVARRCGKLVDFSTSGEGIELDKAVVDQLADPLMHMLRNAVDHGIETPEVRLRGGKPEIGRIELRAVHAGDEVHIEVEDDGRGLDRDAILARAVERGIVRPDETLDDAKILTLVFEPGFSTAAQVTDISGRGVGNDVVKRTVEALRGKVEVRTAPGRSALFRLRLPLTMAVIDGMLVAVGGHRYILPTLSVVRSVQRDEDELAELLGGARAMELNGRWVPVCSLAKLLDVSDAAEHGGRKLVVVVEHGSRRLGLLVDALLGQQQIVIKSLGAAVQAEAVAGGAILPDGTVGLVLDLSSLLDLASRAGSLDAA